jgi:hypothetical protein
MINHQEESMMINYPPMSFEEFQATGLPVSDSMWRELIDEGIVGDVIPTDRKQTLEYAEGWFVYTEDGKYFAYAWYAPVGYDDKDTAEHKLYEWRNEFV